MRSKRLWQLLALAAVLVCTGIESGELVARPDRVVIEAQGAPPPPPPPRVRVKRKRMRGPDRPFRGPITIKMMVIHGSNDYPDFDPRIINLRKHIDILRYHGYRLLFEDSIVLRPPATRSLGLFDGKVIEVTVRSATRRRVTLRVRMYNPRSPNGVMLDTLVSVQRRGTFFVGGPHYKRGVLLLPITAYY